MIDFTTSLLSLGLAGFAFAVAVVSGRRLYLSRGRNTLLYGLACGYAAVAGGAVAGMVTLGGPFDAGAALFACASLPLWAAARALTSAPRIYGAAPADGPVFASCRGRSKGSASASA